MRTTSPRGPWGTTGVLDSEINPKLGEILTEKDKTAAAQFTHAGTAERQHRLLPVRTGWCPLCSQRLEEPSVCREPVCKDCWETVSENVIWAGLPVWLAFSTESLCWGPACHVLGSGESLWPIQ